MKAILQRRISFREGIVVVAIILVLAGLMYAGWLFAREKMIETKLRSALPGVYDDIRSRRQELVTAIEAYRKHFGVYPPDHVLGQQPLMVDSVTNQLLYELVGAVFDPKTKTFTTGITEPVEASLFKEVFNTDQIRNSSEDPEKVRHFLPLSSPPTFEAHDDPDVNVMTYLVNLEWANDEVKMTHVAKHLRVGSWNYTSTVSKHNIGGFDLWIEVEVYGETKTIGNWPGAE